jgi:high-affinity Fe2+/Pb2+ permease
MSTLVWVAATVVWIAMFALIGWMPLRWWRWRQHEAGENAEAISNRAPDSLWMANEQHSSQ